VDEGYRDLVLEDIGCGKTQKICPQNRGSPVEACKKEEKEQTTMGEHPLRDKT